MNPEHIIEEIKHSVSRNDFIKARVVMESFPEFDEKTQNRILFELFKGDSNFTVSVISILLAICPEECKSMPQIRETLVAKLLESPDILRRFLSDDSIRDKSQFIELAGEIGMEEALPILQDLLRRTEDKDVILQVLKTFGSIGDPQVVNTVSEYLFSGERDLIMTAVQSLGLIGTPTAMRRLAERMGTDVSIDLLILQVFSRVQDHISLEKLNENISSHHAHLRNFAKDHLVKIGAKSIPVLLDNLLYDDPDLLIHTLNILGEIGDDSVIRPIRKLLYGEPRNANVRFAAYEALANLPLNKGAFMLIHGLQDPEEAVAVAAAKAIDSNFTEILAAGIRNLIRENDESSEKICKTIIDATVEKIFIGVLSETKFRDFLVQYLPGTHRDIQAHYIQILSEQQDTELLKKVHFHTERKKARYKICAVDDSRMLLNIYKNSLHTLGFDPVLFEFPESAIEWIRNEKPDLVLTDMNMPGINGIELTETLRKTFDAETLPIIMVTTQNDVQDTESAYQAGISSLLFKPFTTEKLREAISEYLTLSES